MLVLALVLLVLVLVLVLLFLGDSTALAHLQATELQQQLASVNRLVREALEALHAAQCPRRASEKAVLEIIDAMIDQVYYDSRVRHEWKLSDTRVEA